MTKTHALIAMGVEMAAGRIMADDGYPSWDEIRSMAYNSGSLPPGARGLTSAQMGVLARLGQGMPMWLDWPGLEDACVTPMKSTYRVVNIERVTTWDEPSVVKTLVYAMEGDADGAPQMCDAHMGVNRITNRLENPRRSTLMDIEELKTKL